MVRAEAGLVVVRGAPALDDHSETPRMIPDPLFRLEALQRRKPTAEYKGFWTRIYSSERDTMAGTEGKELDSASTALRPPRIWRTEGLA